MDRISSTVAVAFALLALGARTFAAELDPKEVISRIDASERKIQDIQCHITVSVPTRTENEVFLEFDWWYKGGKQGYSGNTFGTDDVDGSIRKFQEASVFDGEELRRLRIQQDPEFSGGVITPFKNDFKERFLVDTLLGQKIRYPGFLTVAEALLQAESVVVRGKDSIDGHECIVLEAHKVETDSRALFYDAVVWIDVARDYRVIRLEKYRWNFVRTSDPRYMCYLLEKVNLAQIGGMWFPIYGEQASYYSKRVRPAGMSAEDAEKLSREQVQALPIGLEPLVPRMTLKVDVATLQINKGLDDSKFKLEFPKGTVVVDEIRQVSYVVGKPESLTSLDSLNPALPPSGNDAAATTLRSIAAIRPKESAAQNYNWLIIVAGATAAIAAIAYVLIRQVVAKQSKARQ